MNQINCICSRAPFLYAFLLSLPQIPTPQETSLLKIVQDGRSTFRTCTSIIFYFIWHRLQFEALNLILPTHVLCSALNLGGRGDRLRFTAKESWFLASLEKLKNLARDDACYHDNNEELSSGCCRQVGHIPSKVVFRTYPSFQIKCLCEFSLYF